MSPRRTTVREMRTTENGIYTMVNLAIRVSSS